MTITIQFDTDTAAFNESISAETAKLLRDVCRNGGSQ